MSQSEARRELARLKEEERSERLAAQETREMIKRTRAAAVLVIQKGARRRLAKVIVGRKLAALRAPHLILAERYQVWRNDRMACFRPGYAAHMVSAKAKLREKSRQDRLRKHKGLPQPPLGFFLSSLQRVRKDDEVSMTDSSDSSIGSIPNGSVEPEPLSA